MVAKTPNKSKTPKRPLLSKKAESMKVKDGKVSKAAGTPKGSKPVAKKKREAIKAARMALATGKIASGEQERKHAMDLRTLFVRFKTEVPSDEGAVRSALDNHPEIKFVRIPRQNQKKIRYAFVEFGSEAECEKAKETLTAGPKAKDNMFVDFVGVKSKGGGKPPQERGKHGKKPLNPTRLFIKGLVDGLTEDKLKQLFPKCIKTSIPKVSVRKGSKFGFVQFENPADAKAAFDASQKLTISSSQSKEGHHLTVVYAQQSKRAMKAAQKQREMTKGATDKTTDKKTTDKTSKKGNKKAGKKSEKSTVDDESKQEDVKEEEDKTEDEETAKDEKVEDKKSDDEEAEEGEEGEESGDDNDEEEEEAGEAEESGDDDEEGEEDENMENDAESSEED